MRGNPLWVLVACEFSGTVRDAFNARGHFAVSCDLLPSDRGGGRHYQGDVSKILGWGWDLMIAHPPCTYLANSGVRWLYGGKGTTRDPKRWALMEEGARFFKMLLDADIPRIAVENPIMHGHAKIIVGEDPAQIVQPYQFGHSESKATCFWLRNLPPLRPTNILEGRHFGRVHKESPGADRWKRRSLTYTGIADAMAEQWGGFASSGKIIDSPPPIRVKIPAAELSPNVHRIATRGLG